MTDDPQFKQFMNKVMAPVYLPPDPEAIADALRTRRVVIVGVRRHGKSIAQMVLDMQRELKEPKPLPNIPPASDDLINMLRKLQREQKKDRFVSFEQWFKDHPETHINEVGFVDGFRMIQSPSLAPEDFPDPEPRAKNGALANRKTEAAKAKLPFYHKNRRF